MRHTNRSDLTDIAELQVDDCDNEFGSVFSEHGQMAGLVSHVVGDRV